MSKHQIITSKYALVEAAARCAADLRLPGLSLIVDRQSYNEANGIDFQLDVVLDGHPRRFAVDCRLPPSARDIARFEGRKKNVSPLLAAPHLSKSLVEHCREHGVSCFDLNGRVYLRHRGLLVDRSSPKKRFLSVEPEPALFAAKSCRLARALLSSPGSSWTQLELAKSTRCSTALVSRSISEYVRLGWVEHVKGCWELIKPASLLDAWAGSDRWSRRGLIQQYSTLERDPMRLAKQVTKLLGGLMGDNEHFAFTQ